MASALWSSPTAQILAFPGALPGAVHGQPPDAAGQRPAAVARGARRLAQLRARAARALAGARAAALRRCVACAATPTASTCRHGARQRALRPGRAGLPQRPGAGAAGRCRRARARRSSARSPTRPTTPCCTPTPRLLPRNRKAWAAWNALRAARSGDAVHGQLLHEPAAGHRLAASRSWSRSTAATRSIRRRSCARMRYHHPVYTPRHRSPRSSARPRSRASPHLVRRRVLGLGLPRGRHAQRGRSRARARRALGVTRSRCHACRSAPESCRERRGTRVAAAPLRQRGLRRLVRHRRHAPHAHAFRYRMAQLYLDLAELDARVRAALAVVERPPQRRASSAAAITSAIRSCRSTKRCATRVERRPAAARAGRSAC